jgi:ribosomal subunit interface protein
MEVKMEVSISARNLTVSDRFREYVSERTHKVEHLASRAESMNIKVTRHDHQRAAGVEDQVELTVTELGHVIRAEAHAPDKFAAFDIALEKLAERLRRLGDKNKVHRGQHVPLSLTELSAHDFAELSVHPVDSDVLLGQRGAASNRADSPAEVTESEASIDLGESPVVIRRKAFAGSELTAEEAVDRMELVGHDFYLYLDAQTKKPSVVYRRKGWNYGVIVLG